MNTYSKVEGAWIFVSHSHKDIEKVRKIRNELERRGHNPILFFLKCMDDEDALLPELIRREIKAREWFILCDSPNAKASKWVQDEVALIKSMAQEGNVFETIDLSSDLQTELHKLIRLSKRATVFLSHAWEDDYVAERIRQTLLRHGFGVLKKEKMMQLGDNFMSNIHTAIDDAVTRGFVLVLLSPSSLEENRWCKHEAEYALHRSAQSSRSNIIPIQIAAFDPSLLPSELRHLQSFDLFTGPFEERMEAFIRLLKTRETE